LLRERSKFPMEMFVFFMRDGYVPQGVPMKMFLGEMHMFLEEITKKWLCCLPEWHSSSFNYSQRIFKFKK